MDRIKLATKNLFWGVVSKLVGILLPFVMRTIIIYILGTLYLGLDGLFTSLLNVLSLSELGFSSALIFSMYKPIAENDTAAVCALLNFYKKCYRVIGGVIFVLGLCIMPFLRHLISGTYPQDINLPVLYLIYLINTSSGYFLFAYKKALLNAVQRADIESNINTIMMLLRCTIQIIILFVFKNYYLYAVILPVATILNNLIANYMTKRRYPQYLCSGSIDKELRGEIGLKVRGLVYQKIGGVVLTSVDNVVISVFLGLNILAIYENYHYIILAIFGILSVIMRSLKPSVGNALVLEDKEKNYKQFKTLNYLYVWLVSWSVCCLLCLFQPFMRLWVGSSLMLTDDIMLLWVVYFFSYKWFDMLYVYLEAAGIWWESRMVPIIASAVNLVVNIILVQIIGLSGILISTIVSVLFVYNIGYAYTLFRYCFTQKGALKAYIIKQAGYLAKCFAGCALTYLLCRPLPDTGIVFFLIKVILCIIIPNLVWIAATGYEAEFRQAMYLLGKIAGRK